jgi:prepilin-type N-terminal cleavage/methylation domain-containing protein
MGIKMSRKSAFTLIELLVVIAIIGILAAITFPVYARVKDSAYRSSDTSNLNSLRTAIELYKTDQGAYPPSLLGYVTYYQPGNTVVIPANLLVGALYPKRVEAIDTFRPAYLRGAAAAYTGIISTVVWPSNAGPFAEALCPANSGGVNCANQAFGPNDGIVSQDPNNNNALGITGTPLQYYTISGYDTAQVTTVNGPQRELRYSLFWTGYGLGGGSASDATDQLGYTDPPETTVMTWDSYFRDYDSTGNVVPGEKREIVLFQGGAARPHDSVDVFNRGWQTTP